MLIVVGGIGAPPSLLVPESSLGDHRELLSFSPSTRPMRERELMLETHAFPNMETYLIVDIHLLHVYYFGYCLTEMDTSLIECQQES